MLSAIPLAQKGLGAPAPGSAGSWGRVCSEGWWGGGLQGQPGSLPACSQAGAGTEPTALLSEGPADIHTLGAVTPPCFPTSWAGAHGLVTFEKSPKRKFGQLCDIWVFSGDPKLVAGHY